MGLGEVLGDLWRSWTDSVPGAVLAAVLGVLALVAFAALVIVGRAGRRARRSVVWTLIAAALPLLALASAGLLTPRQYHWWLLGALVATPVTALVARSTLERGTTTCVKGHVMAPTWIYCPACPPPAPPPFVAKPAAGRVDMPAAGTVLPAYAAANVGFPHRPGVGGATVGGTAAPRGEVLLWLVPDGRPEVGEKVVYKPGASLGRNPAAEINLTDPAASWDHARIIERDGGPAIVDVGSSNGTFVNGERVDSSLLIAGDRLRIGDTTWKVTKA